MTSLIKNEIVKLFSKKKTYITLAAFILLIFVITYGTYREKQNEKIYNSPKNQIEEIESQINELNSKLNNSSLSQEEKDNINEQIEKLKSTDEQLKGELSDSTNTNYKEQLKKENAQFTKEIETQKKGNDKDSSILEIENRIKINNYLIDNNIKPQDIYDFNSYSCMNEIFNILGAIFIAIGVAIFASDIVSGEFIPPTMKVLLIQPVSRAKVLFSKYITTLIATLLLIIGTEMIAFLIIGGIFGFGNSAYPNIIGLKYAVNKASMANGAYNLKLIGSGDIIPQWQYFIYTLLLQALFIVSVFSFTFLLSVIFKSSMVSVGLNVVIVIFISIFQSFPVINKVTAYLFFMYGMTSSVLSGDIMRQVNNPNITVPFAVIIMTSWIVICYVTSHIIFKKRDILI